MSDQSARTRRRFLVLAGTSTATVVAGCGGGGGDGGDGELGAVPDQYRTATAQGGAQRNPESLQSKSSVQYQSSPNEGQRCSGCTFYIPDKNGDGLGACAIVEGKIQPDGWCTAFAPYEG